MYVCGKASALVCLYILLMCAYSDVAGCRL